MMCITIMLCKSVRKSSSLLKSLYKYAPIELENPLKSCTNSYTNQKIPPQCMYSVCTYGLNAYHRIYSTHQNGIKCFPLTFENCTYLKGCHLKHTPFKDLTWPTLHVYFLVVYFLSSFSGLVGGRPYKWRYTCVQLCDMETSTCEPGEKSFIV